MSGCEKCKGGRLDPCAYCLMRAAQRKAAAMIARKRAKARAKRAGKLWT